MTETQVVRAQEPIRIKFRSECSCLCSQIDEYGRALRIGWCDWERRDNPCQRRPLSPKMTP